MTDNKIAMCYKVPIRITESHSSMITLCHCGAVCHKSGSAADVNRLHQVWESEHADCATKPREARKIFWLSFCDAKLPKGHQFLGACLIEVIADEAEDATIDVMLQFPFAQPGAEWIAAAIHKAHQLGCNPGGEVATIEIPIDHPNLSHYRFGVLMDREAVEAIDRQLETP